MVAGLETLLPLLAQIPLVGIFVGFVLYTRSEDRKEREAREANWQRLLKEQQAAYERSLEKQNAILTSVVTILTTHDAKMERAVEVMKERTRARSGRDDE